MATDPLPRSDASSEPTEADYRAFCDTVMATGRGRWFLTEYARRHRKATADDALDALARLEHRLHGGRSGDTAHLLEELRSLADTIRHARLEIGWSDSEFSKGAKVMALLELLEQRIGNVLDDHTGGVAAAAEQRGETRVQLTVISANPAPLRVRADLPPVDILADASIVALPTPEPVAEIAPAEPFTPAAPVQVALAGEAPASTLAFSAVELFEPFEAERPGAERTTVPAPVDFAAEPFNVADIAPHAFEAPVATPAPPPAAPEMSPPQTAAAAASIEVPAASETPAAQLAAPIDETQPPIAAPQRPPDYDPMTPVRALSLDERIALVS